jgi:hypothetical protein
MLMSCRSYARILVKETLTNLEFDVKGVTDEEEMLQA